MHMFIPQFFKQNPLEAFSDPHRPPRSQECPLRFLEGHGGDGPLQSMQGGPSPPRKLGERP